METVNARGHAYLSHTRIDGRYMLRLAIGNIRTDRTHIETAWRELRDVAAAERSAVSATR
jgi:aromatic-L-amino-acid decarboxylase